MKKLVSVTCIIMLLIGVLAGCTSGGNQSAAAPEETKAPEGNSEAAASWPEKPVNIIMTHGAGGDTDYNGRLLSKNLEAKLGKPFVVTNVTGGNGSIAMTQGKDTNPDGYTFVVTNTAALSANEASGLVDFGYNAFDPVAIYGKQSGEVLIVKGDASYNTVEELIAATSDNPGKIKLGISMGGAVYAASIMIERSGAQFAVVDAGDGADRMASLIGGHVDATIVPYLTAREYIENGDVKPMCTLMSTRSAGMPDVPTAQEAGIKELVIDTMYAVLAPKGTDPAIIEKLNAAIQDIVLKDEEYGKTYLEFNFQKPWALSVKDSITELDKQREHFMSLSEYLQ